MLVLDNVFMFIAGLMEWLCSIPMDFWVVILILGIVLGIISFLLRHLVKVLIVFGTTMLIITSFLTLI